MESRDGQNNTVTCVNEFFTKDLLTDFINKYPRNFLRSILVLLKVIETLRKFKVRFTRNNE